MTTVTEGVEIPDEGPQGPAPAADDPGTLRPASPRSVAVMILAGLAIVYTLVIGKEILLPVTLALVLKLLLEPLMRVLTRRVGVPRTLAALLLVVVALLAVAAAATVVAVPAAGWLQKLPQSLPVLKEKLSALQGPIDAVQRAVEQMGAMAGGGGGGEGKEGGGGGGGGLPIKEGVGVVGDVFTGTALVLTRFFVTMLFLFFMLTAGDRLMRGLVEVLPGYKEKRQAVGIVDEIEDSISGYLVTITAMNALVGVAVGASAWVCGLGDPMFWGALAFLLNYVPILGPLCGVVVFFAAGLLTLPWPFQAILPAVLYLAIHVLEGEAVTPMLLAKRFTLNPVLVIISLFFWHEVWGITGAFLAVPLLAVAKILCDRVERLKPAGHIIGS